MSDSGQKITGTKVITRHLRDGICSGRWKVGSTLPTIRQLSAQLGASHQSVQSAIRLIEAEGLIKCRSRRPAVVTGQSRESVPVHGQEIALKRIGFVQQLDNVVAGETWHHHIYLSAQNELLANGYDLLVVPFDQEQSVIAHLLRNGCDGAIFSGHRSRKGLHQAFKKSGIPWVCLGGVEFEDDYNVVHGCNYEGGTRLGRIFVKLGLRKILILGDDQTVSISSCEKIGGVLRAYLEQAMPIDRITVRAAMAIDEQAGYNEASRYISEFGTPEAIFAVGDLLALGAMRACQNAGLAVGKDVSVVGATGLDLAATLQPSLTVLKQPMEEMGKGAAKLLIDMIEHNRCMSPSKGFPSQIILRNSLYIPPELKNQIAMMV